MHIYIRCCSCGNNIGAFYEAYTTILKARHAEKLESLKEDLKIDYVSTTDKIQVSMADVFDAMEIKRYCCRMRMIGAAIITDIKKGY